MIRYLEICWCSGWTGVVVESWDHTQELPSPVSLLSLPANLCAKWSPSVSTLHEEFSPMLSWAEWSWADSRESRAEHSSQTTQLHAGQEGQVEMRWGVGKDENWERVIRRAASLGACCLSELWHCKETEFSFLISETTPPAFQKGWTWHRISMMAHRWSRRAMETTAFCKSFYKAVQLQVT